MDEDDGVGSRVRRLGESGDGGCRCWGCVSCAVFGAFAGGGGGGGTVLGEGPLELEAACVGVEMGGAPRRGALTGLL